MSEFHFQKSQRVIVPPQAAGAEGVQGIVSGIFDRLGREVQYVVQWMRSDATDEDGKGTFKGVGQSFTESDLLKAQPPKTITFAEAQAMVDADRAATHETYLDDVRALTTRIERLQAAARRRGQKLTARKRH